MLEQTSLYNGTVILKFEPRFHLYTVDGTKVDGVTSATKMVDKSGPLMHWAVNSCVDFLRNNLKPGMSLDEVQISELLGEAAKQHRIFKERAGNTGTMIHEWIEKWIKGENPPEPINLSMKNAVGAFKDWVAARNVKFLLSERKVYSKKYRYAGTLDHVGVLGDEKLTVGDTKTSSGIYEEMRYQVSAYLEALKEEIEFLQTLPAGSIKDPKDVQLMDAYKAFGGIRGREIVRIGKEAREDGTFDLEAQELEDHEKDFDCFLSCLILFRRQKQLKGMVDPTELKIASKH